MRILSHCDGFLNSVIGGVEVLNYHLLRRLKERGHEVLVLSSRIGEEPEIQSFDGIDVVKFEFNGVLSSRDLGAMRRLNESIANAIAKFQPDIIHINDSRPSSFFQLRGGVTGNLPRLLTVHSPAPTDTAGGLLRRLAADADRIVAVSDAHGRELASALPQATPKLSVIPNSIPFPAIAPTPLPLDKPLVLCVGRLAEEKGFDLALRALAILNKGGISLDLAIAGNGPVKGDLERLALDLGIAHLVHFTDWILPPDMPDMLNLSTILLIPSRWAEPFGLVALQAAQMARPVIATNRGGLPEIVIHDETGLLVPPDDALALVDAIRKLLDYPENTVAMAQNARKRVKEGFDFGHMVDAYEAAFDSVIVKARSSAPGGSV